MASTGPWHASRPLKSWVLLPRLRPAMCWEVEGIKGLGFLGLGFLEFVCCLFCVSLGFRLI